MQKITGFTFILLIGLFSCSRKTTSSSASSASTSKVETAAVKKPVAKPAAAVPKVITVNDKVASRSVDGRYYYDLNGRRYWRSKKDGKYYLYNKSMYNNKAFQP